LRVRSLWFLKTRLVWRLKVRSFWESQFFGNGDHFL
jgi:hypothetical protein